jgi:hypothetical protein
MKYSLMVALLLCSVSCAAQEPPELVIKSAVTHPKPHHSMSAKYLLKHNNDYDKCVYTDTQMKQMIHSRPVVTVL